MHDEDESANDAQSPDDPTVGPGELPTRTFGGTDSSDAASSMPVTIGRYKILGKLGEGGMGVVYEAEQRSPRRRVAVKVVRGGQFVDEHHVRMFQREADTLARLKHSNIAAIYESGRTQDGQHFFAMELVQGETLDTYLRKRGPAGQSNPPSPDELRFRLSLFRTIADAVHYAHQRGVIHRDLKPSNIIVSEETTREDDVPPTGSMSSELRLPEIKILDFGLARITEGDVAAATMTTEVGVIKGTLPYMSPEQARGDPQEIDVRTDVYALGVILYEMLSGKRPYDVLNRALVEALRVICEEPALPIRQSLDRARKLDPDVETIANKALEKDVDHRYASAAALSEQISRYLTSQPILARPPSTVYQLRKFAARNRALVGGVLATFVVLLAGIVVSTLFGLREAAQRREAEWRSYLGNVAAAEANLNADSASNAKRRLADCPPSLRDWEWYYLASRTESAVATLEGHDEAVASVSFSPDGLSIVSGLADGRVQVRDALSGELISNLVGHEGWVSEVRFSPDGTRIASGSGDGTVRLWNATSGELQATLKAERKYVVPAYAWMQGQVYSLAFSPDGTRLVSGSIDGTVDLWDAASGEPLATLVGHQSWVMAVAYGPKGRRLASGSDDGTVRVWDVASGRTLTTLVGHGERVLSVAFSPDGRRIASGALDGMVLVWDAASGEPLMKLAGHENFVTSVAFSPDGVRIASASADRTVRLWDSDSGELRAALAGHEETVQFVAFSPDGTRIASASADHTIRIWIAEAPEFSERLLGHERRVQATYDEHASFSSRTVVALSADGAHIASGSTDRTVRLWDAASGELRARLVGHEASVESVAFSPDGTWLASGSYDYTVRLWDVVSGEHLTTLNANGLVSSVAVSPDGDHVAAQNDLGEGLLWDLSSGEGRPTVLSHESPIAALAFHPDGERIVTGSEEGAVCVWDVTSGQLLETLPVDDRDDQVESWQRHVSSIVVSPDGSRIAAGSMDYAVRLWHLPSRRPPAILAGHEDEVTSVSFSPNGQRLATGSADNTLRVWDVVSGEPLITVRHDLRLGSVAFCSDGMRIATGVNGGVVRLLNPKPRDQIRLLAAAARTYEQLGEDRKAEPSRRAVVEVHPRSKTAATGELGTALIQLGANLSRQGKYAEAEPFLREVLRLPSEFPSMKRWRLSQARSLLGQALAGLGRSVEAEPLLLGGLTELLDSETAPLETRCGAIERVRGAYAMYGAAKESVDGSSARRWTSNLLPVLDARGRKELARHLLTCAADEPGYVDDGLALSLDLTRGEAETDPELLEIVALGHWRSGEVSRAFEYQQRILSSLPAGPSWQRLRVESTLHAWPAALILRATTLIQQQRFDEAEPLLRDCLAMQQEVVPVSHWRVPLTMIQLAQSLVGQGREAEAEPILLDAHAALSSHEERAEIYKRFTIKTLVRLYERSDQPGKAAEWRKKLESEDDES